MSIIRLDHSQHLPALDQLVLEGKTFLEKAGPARLEVMLLRLACEFPLEIDPFDPRIDFFPGVTADASIILSHQLERINRWQLTALFLADPHNPPRERINREISLSKDFPEEWRFIDLHDVSRELGIVDGLSELAESLRMAANSIQYPFKVNEDSES